LHNKNLEIITIKTTVHEP